VTSPWGQGVIQSSLNGRFNAYNLLATLAVLSLLDVPFDEALDSLSKVKAVPGRMECFSVQGKAKVFIDYAHTPDALEQALKSLQNKSSGGLVCVFGCGGDRDKGKRALMGEVAEKYADRIILTSDNPRNESAEQIINDILTGTQGTVPVQIDIDRGEAIRFAICESSIDDVLLIAGKGHETFQEISGKRYPFSDRQLVRELLEKGA